MAVTEIWKVDNRLDHVLKYTTSEDKTDGNNYKDLHNVLDYIEADYKTEKQLYVTGINCLPETAYKEMLMTKQHYHKTGGILAFHAFQSFAPGEVTPQICHEIGVKLAEEMWGDRFEVVVSTHLNRNHLHNHFVINSVSFKDGKKYYDKRDTYAELRHLSDSLCEEYGLSVIKQKEIKKFKVNYSNYQVKNLKNDNYYSTAKKDIDRAIGMANSYIDFEKLLNAMGYEVKYRYNVLTIRRDPYKKSIRVKNYGDDYTDERITERIKVESIPRVPFLNEFSNNKYYRDYNYKHEKPKGIYALYLHYCYLLNVFPKKNPYKRLPPSIKNDSLKLDKISEEAKLLVSYNLETDEQFFSFKKSKIEELNNLINKRESLWYKYHHEKNNDGIGIKIKEIKPKIDEGNEKKISDEETKTILSIKIVSKSKEEIMNKYHFKEKDINKVNELLSKQYDSLWRNLIYGSLEGNHQIVEIAKQQIGNVGGEPYWRWYGFNHRIEWCAVFVSWAANQAGLLNDKIPKFSGVYTGIEWFKARGQWQGKGYSPRPGDIIFFDWEVDGKPNHVGIVEKTEDDYIYTIEGNSTDDGCRAKKYQINSKVIYGFGVPAY